MKRLSKTLFVCGMVINLFLAIVAAAAASSVQSDNSGIVTFSDVGTKDNNYLFIKYLVNRDLIKGFPDGTFHPTDGLTRAQAAALLCRAAGLTAINETSRFSDVDANHWATGSIAAADVAGYLRGYPDGTFHPDTVLSRCEGVSLLLRLSKQPDVGVALPSLLDFGFEHWAARPVAIGLASGMVGLTADKKQFLPDTPFTRGDLTRALAVLLTQDSTLAQTSILGKLKVLQGTVTVTRNGSQSSSTIKEGVEINTGDTIKIGQDGSAEVIFPDGTGLKLEENTELKIKESRGRFYIKFDGTPGTTVDWLELDLKNGKMFGALATRYESNHKDMTEENKTNNTVGLKNYPLVAALDNSFLAGSKDLIALEDNNELPWWQAQNTKRVRVKVDMPWGVAAIRGTFWHNIVNANGSGRTSLLTGEGEVIARGQTVCLTAGLSTEVTRVGSPPTPAAPMRTEDKKDWVKVKDWSIERAKDIQSNQRMSIPPPTPAVEHPEVEKQLDNQAQETQPPQSTSDAVQDAYNNTGISSGTTSTSPSSGGGGTPAPNPLELSNAGTYNNDYTITASGVFGPASGTSIINGTLTLNPGSTGEVTLQNIDASSIIVQSGASSSIHLKNVKVSVILTVDTGNQTNSVHVITEGNTSVFQTEIKSNVILEALSGSLISKLIVVQTADVSLLGQGTVQNIVVNKGATNTNITIDQNADLTVNILTLQDTINLSGNIEGISSVTGDSGVVIEGQQQEVQELNELLQAVESDRDTLNIFAEGDSADSVTKNLNLPVKGNKGTNINWSSNNSDVIAVNGTVNRPGVGQADVSVTLTATITSGKVTKTVTFDLTVKSLTPCTIVSINPVEVTVIKAQQYSLPSTVDALMSDGTTQPYPVTWDPPVAVTVVEGVYEFNGTVSGYSGNVKLTLTVIDASVAPQITSIVPTSGMADALVMIIGSNFGSTRGEVLIGGAPIDGTRIVSWSDTSIEFYVPNIGNSSGVNLSVRMVGGLESNKLIFNFQGVVPSLPAAYYGKITVNGGELAAGAGTVVEARVNGQSVASVTTTVDNQYGDSAKLVVQGIDNGTTIEFWLKLPNSSNYIKAVPTCTYISGDVREVDLALTLALPL